MNYPQFEDTIPTDFGGLNERRHYTAQSQRTGFLMFAACALAVVGAALLIVLV